MSWRALLVALLGCACSDPGVERVNDPYGGSPFSSTKGTFALPDGEIGVVSNSGSDSISLLDLTKLEIIGSAPVGRDPVALDGPHHVVVDRGAGVVFTALSYPPPALPLGPHAAHGSSARAGYVQKLALEDLAPLAEVEVEVNPGDIVLSEDGQRLVVSHFDLVRALGETDLTQQRADLALLDAETLGEGAGGPRLVRTCIAPHGIALSRPDGAIAFVACYGEDALAVVDTTDENQAPELVSIGPGGLPGIPVYGPYAAVLSPDGRTIAVSNTLSNDVRLFDVETRTFTSTVIATTSPPYFSAWASDGKRLFIPTQSQDALLTYDVESDLLTTVKTFEPSECERPHVAAFGSDPETLYLVCEGDHETPSVVLALNADSLEVEASLEVGVYPDALVIAGAP